MDFSFGKNRLKKLINSLLNKQNRDSFSRFEWCVFERKDVSYTHYSISCHASPLLIACSEKSI